MLQPLRLKARARERAPRHACMPFFGNDEARRSSVPKLGPNGERVCSYTSKDRDADSFGVRQLTAIDIPVGSHRKDVGLVEGCGWLYIVARAILSTIGIDRKPERKNRGGS